MTERAAAATTGKAAPRTGGYGSVLVVDDDPMSLELVRRILTGEGWEVRTAAGGAEALELLDRRVAACVVTDVRMPGMSGVELAHLVAERHPDVRLAAMTAYPADVEDAVAAGVFEGVIEKPIENLALAGTLDWLFFRRHLV